MSTKRINLVRFRVYVRRTQILCLVLILALGITPLLMSQKAGASQLTARSLTATSGVPGGTSVKYTYGFTYVSSASAIQSIKFVSCTTALATYAGVAACTGAAAPTGQTINAGSQVGTVGGSWTNTTGFTRDAVGAGGCTPAANVLCIKRTQAASESAAAKTIQWDTQTNPTTANSTYYIGIFLYSDTGWTTATDSGTVAGAVVQSLTVNAAVAEILQFCVGSTTINDATTTPGTDCSAISGTSLNIGTLDTSAVNTSPVNTNGGDNKNGVAMLRTNASSGATVSYDAIQAGSGTNHLGTLRITGAACNAGDVSTDGCIDAQGSTQGTFTAGTEKFGMTIGGTNCGSVSASSYSCSYASATEHLVPSSNYIGAAANAYGVTNGFAWVETAATVTQIASSSQPVDDEALILRFAATPSITTPFGAYSVVSDYIAVPTY